jgi:ATP-dependent Clp protease adaptor protein ClpS
MTKDLKTIIQTNVEKKKTRRLKKSPLRLPRYHVVLLDDNEHTYDYVIEMLMQLFGHSRAKAFQMASIVDTMGWVIVDTTTKERAELKRDQIHGYGPDWRVPHCRGSMSAVIEQAASRH